MQFIELDNLKDFDELQNKIHQNRLLTVKGYNAERWAMPLQNIDKSKIVCKIPDEDLKILSGIEKKIILTSNNKDYFPEDLLKFSYNDSKK